jgi:hypothetical protein
MSVDPVADVVQRILETGGGVGLLLESLMRLPKAQWTPPKKSMFSSKPGYLQLGDWRYMEAADGRLNSAHAVAGVVIASGELSPAEAGTNVAVTLQKYIRDHGLRAGEDVEAVLAGLSAALGDG